ncbi:hypothetical protein [Runella sp.]|jgi:heme/copper-type cytochrome/quinol oxidase subunit 1|uniref:hypothetical protein n=1 Tax=Runella sp. TaxID=1960881 RepID=UPI00262647A9|nr:hypothetical protein [Runella sp.]
MKNSPAFACWMIAGLSLVVGIFSQDKIIDIQFHDTYFVISQLYLSLFFSFVLGLEAVGYQLIERNKGRLIRGLNWIHLVLTFGSISVLFLVSIDPDAIIGNQSEFKRWQSLEAVSIGAVLLFVFSQLVYLLNLGIGFFRRIKN